MVSIFVNPVGNPVRSQITGKATDHAAAKRHHEVAAFDPGVDPFTGSAMFWPLPAMDWWTWTRP